MKKVKLEEVIIEMMPFSKELVNWCKIHPQFLVALKNIHAEKFISLMAIVTSYSPNYPSDEVIGIYTYDYKRKNPVFKQDFIINKGKLNKEFVLFTRNNKSNSSKYVKDINEFFKTYGEGGFYVNSHHLSLDQLPDKIRQRGEDAIRLADKIKSSDLSQIPQKHINKIYKKLRTIKTSEWHIKEKLNY